MASRGGLASVNIKYAVDNKGLSTQMQESIKQVKKISQQFMDVGKSFSLYVTAPIVALAGKSVQLFDVQAKAIAQVEAGLKSTGNAAGRTSEQLQRMASSLQDNSLFGDEEILKGVTAQLLTFTNIAGQQFDRTQQAALDLATRLDGDLKSSAIQLGKALNDPKANLSALSRSGIQFSKDQKQVINALQESGRLAEAQNIILTELEKQYGGSAKAAAEAGAGGLKQLSNSLGDLLEEFGAIIYEGIKPLIASLKDAVKWVQSLSPEVKKIIVVVGGLAAAIGPVLLGIGTMLKLVPLVVSGFQTISKAAAFASANFVTIAAVVGVAFLAYKAFAAEAEKLTAVQKTIRDVNLQAAQSIANEREQIDSLLKVAKDENAAKSDKEDAIKRLNDLSPEYLGNITLEEINTKNTTEAIDAYIKSLEDKAAAQAAQTKRQELFAKKIELENKALGENKNLMDDVLGVLYKKLGIDTTGTDIKNREELEEYIKTLGLTGKAAEGLRKAYNPYLKQKEEDIKIIEDQIEALRKYGIVENDVTGGGGGGGDDIPLPKVSAIELPQIEESKGTTAALDKQIAALQNLQSNVSTTGEMYQELQKEIDGLEFRKQLITDATQLIDIEPIQEQIQSVTDQLTFFQQNAQTVAMGVGDAFASMGGRFVDSLGLAETGFQGFMKNMAATITQLISMMLAQSISQAIAGASASALATGPGAIFTQPAFIAQAVGGVLSAFAAIPKFETGGLIPGNSFSGDNMIIRANSGERVLNAEQQRWLESVAGTAGGGVADVNVKGEIEIAGSALRVVLDRADNQNSRKK